MVKNGQTLINCLAYIDLNPVRANLVNHPEDYRWCGLGYHIQTGNYGNFLSLDFGLKEFGPVECASLSQGEFNKAGMKDPDEIIQRYRELVYETGTIEHPANPTAR